MTNLLNYFMTIKYIMCVHQKYDSIDGNNNLIRMIKIAFIKSLLCFINVEASY